MDYAAVAGLKLEILETLFDVRGVSTDPLRRQAFAAFRQERGEVLERNCLFLALREHFADRDSALADWHCWPDEYRDPTSPVVVEFAARHRATA